MSDYDSYGRRGVEDVADRIFKRVGRGGDLLVAKEDVVHQDWIVLVEESGQRVRGRDQDHFIPTAAVFRRSDLARAQNLVRSLEEVKRGGSGNKRAAADDSWKTLKDHRQRVASSQLLGSASSWLTLISVVLCHHEKSDRSRNEEAHTYQETIGYLLQRAAWFIREAGGGCGEVVFASIKNYNRPQLEKHYSNLRRKHLELNYLLPHFQYVQAAKEPLLLIPDRAAGAVHSAVEGANGFTERRYLLELSNSLYRYKYPHAHGGQCTARQCLNGYGLKLWPDNDTHGDLLRSPECRCDPRPSTAPARRAEAESASAAGDAYPRAVETVFDCTVLRRVPLGLQTTAPSYRSRSQPAPNPFGLIFSPEADMPEFDPRATDEERDLQDELEREVHDEIARELCDYSADSDPLTPEEDAAREEFELQAEMEREARDEIAREFYNF